MKFKTLKEPVYRLSIILLLSLATKSITAQDFDAISKAPFLATNGGISISQIANYIPHDTTKRALPYTYYVSGNINFNLFSVVNLPLSFAFTNNQITSNAALPFNRFTLTPTYKWLKLYLGYSSLTFSPYTLAGHEIYGGGFEITSPKGLKFTAIYGRLQKEVRPDSGITEAFYRRMGGGFKIEHSSKYADIAFSIFKAKDVPNALFYFQNDSFVTPKDNLTGSILLNIKMIHNVKLNIEYALSALNSDISKKDSLANVFSDRFIEQKGDLTVHHALKTSISQTSLVGTIGATYERVDPNYNTFGSYYFMNDYENITANFSTSIKKFLNFSVDAGYQHDNLSSQKLNSSKRFIFSSNVSSIISKKMSLGAAFSNVQSFIHIKDIYNVVTATNQFQNLDTLSFSQLNLTTSCNANYILQSSKVNRQSLNVSFTYQEASQQQKSDTKYAGNSIYNYVISYQFTKIPKKFNFSTSLNYNYNKLPVHYMGVISYNISMQQAFFEKLKISCIGTYSKSFNDSLTLANILNVRVAAGYTLLKRHNFNLSLAKVYNKGLQRTVTQYSANLTYSYIFDFNLKRKDKKLKFEGDF